MSNSSMQRNKWRLVYYPGSFILFCATVFGFKAIFGHPPGDIFYIIDAVLCCIVAMVVANKLTLAAKGGGDTKREPLGSAASKTLMPTVDPKSSRTSSFPSAGKRAPTSTGSKAAPATSNNAGPDGKTAASRTQSMWSATTGEIVKKDILPDGSLKLEIKVGGYSASEFKQLHKQLDNRQSYPGVDWNFEGNNKEKDGFRRFTATVKRGSNQAANLSRIEARFGKNA